MKTGIMRFTQMADDWRRRCVSVEKSCLSTAEHNKYIYRQIVQQQHPSGVLFLTSQRLLPQFLLVCISSSVIQILNTVSESKCSPLDLMDCRIDSLSLPLPTVYCAGVILFT